MDKLEKQVLLTVDGMRSLEEELEHLKTVSRKDISEKIKVALSFGDLSENSEYDEAKNEQAQVESRIAEIEAMLKYAQIINEDEITADIIRVGNTVRLLDKDFNETEEYKIVGSTEANPAKGSISDESPVGKALLGKAVGESIDVECPGGVIHYIVLDISK